MLVNVVTVKMNKKRPLQVWGGKPTRLFLYNVVGCFLFVFPAVLFDFYPRK